MIAINTMIKVERLIKCFPEDFEWNDNEVLNMNDITDVIEKGQSEEAEPFNPHISMPYEWHIRRIIYFINHPEEIEFIDIGNVNDGDFFLPSPVIIEGNHRFLAAGWLFVHDENKIKEIYCSYKGRKDVLEYLTGKSNKIPSDWKKKTDTIDIRDCCIINNNGEYYYTFNSHEVSFTTDIKRAFKLTESSANDLINMFNEEFPGDIYSIVKETIGEDIKGNFETNYF